MSSGICHPEVISVFEAYQWGFPNAFEEYDFVAICKRRLALPISVDSAKEISLRSNVPSNQAKRECFAFRD